jgi:hypothetical protein
MMEIRNEHQALSLHGPFDRQMPLFILLRRKSFSFQEEFSVCSLERKLPSTSSGQAHLDAEARRFMLRAFKDDQVLSHTKPGRKKQPLGQEEKELLYCAYCLKLITSGDQRIRMGGSHEHTFSNPTGITFRIGCFQDAQGSVTHGIPTDEFTWFKGFQWSMAYCEGCLKHIGWQYLRSGQGAFWGLILNMLTTRN